MILDVSFTQYMLVAAVAVLASVRGGVAGYGTGLPPPPILPHVAILDGVVVLGGLILVVESLPRL
ncbi:hypothetical protein [Hansschlegelia plantiphila]|uniref:Uncharacterized protein n=1 Tax=Hansschlegelia plantiphila TaxID=374655 RepID=A0A9W6J2Y2_9HYPH|nr:hypothetical protein [Hansschlegelia plantiphila]GLK68408.1 hypothetical protein GCM10008179_20460 [Hansschlegelia plantiphila]